jgi:hypothetical protein
MLKFYFSLPDLRLEVNKKNGLRYLRFVGKITQHHGQEAYRYDENLPARATFRISCHGVLSDNRLLA